MANVLKKIPKGWELVPVGEKITAGCQFCSHPFKEWEPIIVAPYLHKGICQPPDSPSLPHGHYIRRK